MRTYEITSYTYWDKTLVLRTDTDPIHYILIDDKATKIQIAMNEKYYILYYDKLEGTLLCHIKEPFDTMPVIPAISINNIVFAIVYSMVHYPNRVGDDCVEISNLYIKTTDDNRKKILMEYMNNIIKRLIDTTANNDEIDYILHKIYMQRAKLSLYK